jgi:P27 family predicted phage terminase small subunit
MAGRKNKPTALKLLAGNPGKRLLNNNEPDFSGSPKCPPWLHKDGKTEWRRVVIELEALNMLTACDQASLAAYCQTFARWKEAEALTSLHGMVLSEPVVNKAGEVIGQRMRRNPANIIASDCLKSLARYGSLFGFDPSSRSRLHVAPNEAADPLDEFLNASGDEDDTEPVSSGAVH